MGTGYEAAWALGREVRETMKPKVEFVDKF